MIKKNKKRKQLTNKRKRFLITNAFLALFLFIGIGYSALDANLNIFGNIQMKKYERNTLYNNEISSIQEYKLLVEDWILFYNTYRIKSKSSRN